MDGLDTLDRAGSADPETAGTSAETDGARCLSCGAERQGKYCHACGQRFADGPLRFRDLAGQFVRVVFDLENGLWHTLRLAATNPGEVGRRYLEGNRRPFVSPVAFFLIGATALFLTLGMLEDRIVALTLQAQPDFPTGDPDALVAALIGAETTTEYVRTVFAFQQKYFTYLQLIGLVPIAALLTLLGSGRSFVEMLAVEFYVQGQIMLYSVVLAVPLLLQTDHWTLVFSAMGSLSVLLQVGLHAQAAYTVFDRTWGAAVRGVLAFLIGTGVWAGVALGGLYLAASFLA